MNDSIAPFELRRYSPSGALLDIVAVASPYFDIATNSNGSRLYALESGLPTRLDTVDPATGAVLSSVAISGVPATEFLNGLSRRADGMLLAGDASANTLYLINPVTAVATVLPVSLAPGRSLAGDIITLRDHDLLAVDEDAATESDEHLVRIHPDGSRTVVGHLPNGTGFYGLTVSGGRLFLAATNGAIYRLPAPPRAPSDRLLPLRQVVAPSAGLSWYGAASVEDSGRTCGKQGRDHGGW
ncbi:hypothetical protein [Streptantibioticus silvisoli]|uniref:Uncharacterized protein n=1 Tax=Streptantibioticus silvisoli TaxID=2705255 RepID=A0ABT6VUV8_9ACTN|nr:hypothetical protein [Streptantibioticus silvisoli]MDI5962261.1 hypothetical protein [Streptantibioticus silvisoli]